MECKRNPLKSKRFLVALGLISLGLLGASSWMIWKGSPSPQTVGENSIEGDPEASEAPLVAQTVKRMNASQGRSPAVEDPAKVEAQILASYRSWLKEKALGERDEQLRSYLGASEMAEPLAAAHLIAQQREIPDELREVYEWAQHEIHSDRDETVQALTLVLNRAGTDQEAREWAVGNLYQIAQDSEVLRSGVKTTLLKEVNRQGIQTLEGMTTLVKVLRIQHSQEWTDEVRREFEAMNPGTDLSEFVAFKED